MKIPYLTTITACVVSLVLAFPVSDGRAENPSRIARATPTSEAKVARDTVGRHRPGGVRICLPADMTDARVHGISVSEKALVATFESGATITIANESTTVKSLMAVAAQDSDHCIEVSIDQVTPHTYNYYASDGLDGSSVAKRLLALDAELAGLYRGGYQLSRQQLGSAHQPHEQARRLFSSEGGSSAFRELALRYAKPPSINHMTTMNLKSGDGFSIDWDVHISPQFSSPDGQDLYVSGNEKTVAAMPYMPLIQRFETAPQEFSATMPHLEHGLNIARTYGLVSACQQTRTPACQRLFDAVTQNPGPLPESQAQVQVQTEQWVWAWAKYDHLTKVWQEYRDRIDYNELNHDQRVAFAVDEALARYRDLTTAQAQSQRTGISPQAILALTANVDLARARYGGWGYLSRFLGMVWAGSSFTDTMEALEQAYRHAEAGDDVNLRYQVLCAVRELLPVISSNLYVAERAGTSLDLIEVTFDPAGELRSGVRMGPRGYLSYLDRSINDAIEKHMKAEYHRLATRVRDTVRGDVTRLTVRETQTLLFDIRRSHIEDEIALLDEDILELLAPVHYAIGLAAINENDLGLARNHLRMLHSIEAVNQERETKSKSIQPLLDDLQNRLGHNPPLLPR